MEAVKYKISISPVSALQNISKKMDFFLVFSSTAKIIIFFHLENIKYLFQNNILSWCVCVWCGYDSDAIILDLDREHIHKQNVGIEKPDIFSR